MSLAPTGAAASGHAARGGDMPAAGAEISGHHSVRVKVNQVGPEQCDVEPPRAEVEIFDPGAHRLRAAYPGEHVRALVYGRHRVAERRQRMTRPAPAPRSRTVAPSRAAACTTVGSRQAGSWAYNSTAQPSRVMTPGPVPGGTSTDALPLATLMTYHRLRRTLILMKLLSHCA